MGEMSDYFLSSEDYWEKVDGLALRVSAPEQSYTYQINEGSCPKCGGKTVIVNGRYGKFFGCTAFPECNGSRPYRRRF